MKSSATKTALTSIVIVSCIGIGVGKKFEKKIKENKELTKNLEQVTNTVNFLKKKVICFITRELIKLLSSLVFSLQL